MVISFLCDNTFQFSDKMTKTLKGMADTFIQIKCPTEKQIYECWEKSDLIVWVWCKTGLQYLTTLPKRQPIIAIGIAGDILPRMEYACVRERCKFRDEVMYLSRVTTYKTLAAMDWSKIDVLYVETGYIAEEFKQLYPGSQCKVDVLLYRDFVPEEKTSFPNTACIICRVSIEKDLLFAIQAFKSLPHWRLKIQGPIPSDSKEWFDKEYYEFLLKESSSVPNVEFVEWGDPLPTYRSSSVILSTSISEGIANTVFEGMLLGCYPVVRNWKGADRIYAGASIIRSKEELVSELTKYGSFDLQERKRLSVYSTDLVMKNKEMAADKQNKFELMLNELARKKGEKS